MPNETQLIPYRIEIPQATLTDLDDRLHRARLDNVGHNHVHGLVDYWRDGYDWRAWEAKINARPQFTTEIDGHKIHFLHVRSPHPHAFPLILTHGWPGSIVEYLDLIDPLTHPDDPALAFDVVIPSIPGFGFSGPADGWDRYRIARAWAELMRRVGYEHYGAVGNDVGSTISLELGRTAPDRVAGVHVTQIFSLPDAAPADELTDDDIDRLRFSQRFIATKGAYLRLHATRPELLAPALTDSPAGLLGWNSQLFAGAVDADFTLTNVMIYWLTGTGASSIRLYHQDAQATRPAGPTTSPIALAEFTDDFFHSIRHYAHRDHSNIVSWNRYSGGGHYAAHQAPDLLAKDIRDFFRLASRSTATAA